MKSNKKEKDGKVIWIIGGIVFIILAAGAMYFGTKNTEKKFDEILIIPKKPDTEALLFTTSRPMPTENLTPTDTTEPTPPSDEKDLTVYLLPKSGSQKIIKDDLIDFSDLDLKKARNEIYARHGRAFVSKDMACYFTKQTWYQIDSDYSEKSLSSLEVANAVFILNYEKEMNSPWINKDSGCVE